MSLESYPWQTKELSRPYEALAVDNTEIRTLFSTGAASVVHCTLPPKSTSVASRNIEINEIWYFITGQGDLWRRQEETGNEETVRVGPGIALTMPENVGFQFRSCSEELLTFLCVVMPSWPGEHMNIVIEGPWQPSISTSDNEGNIQMPEPSEDEEAKGRLAEVLANQEIVLQNRALATRFAEIAKVDEYEERHELYSQGEPGKGYLYFILSGEFDLLDKRNLIAIISSGQAVGEFPILEPGLNYTVTCRAREKSVVALVPAGKFVSIAEEEYPEIWKNMAKMLVRRLCEAKQTRP